MNINMQYAIGGTAIIFIITLVAFGIAWLLTDNKKNENPYSKDGGNEN